MTALERKQQSIGGSNRAKNQSTEDQKFLGMLAASRRPLLHDANVTPEGLLKELSDLEQLRRWFYLGVVVADKGTVNFKQPKEKFLKRIQETGGAVGLIGITAFGKAGNRVSLQTFYRPLKKGSGVIEKLDKAGREVMAILLETFEASKDMA